VVSSPVLCSIKGTFRWYTVVPTVPEIKFQRTPVRYLATSPKVPPALLATLPSRSVGRRAVGRADTVLLTYLVSGFCSHVDS
jgi:hypothetical protein